MKINKGISKKILLGATVAVIGISAVIVGTRAKYFNEVTGDGEIEVAKWYFDVNNATETMATIDLAETYDEDTLVNGKIAPGTKGQFDLVINAGESDVGVDYTVEFTNEQHKPENLKFKVNGVELPDSTKGITGYNSVFTGNIKPEDARTVTLPIEWEWEYETGMGTEIDANDEKDTEDGLAALDYTFDVLVTGTQVVPTK